MKIERYHESETGPVAVRLPNKMPVVYIAGPFRGENAWEIEQNVRRVEEVGLYIARKGAMPLMPHANTRFFQGTLPDEFWIDGTSELLLRADALYLHMGWEKSQGSMIEKELAESVYMPVFVFERLNLLVEWIAQEKKNLEEAWKKVR